MVLEAAAADLRRSRGVASLHERLRELDEDARARIGREDLLVFLEDGREACRGAQEPTNPRSGRTVFVRKSLAGEVVEVGR